MTFGLSPAEIVEQRTAMAPRQSIIDFFVEAPRLRLCLLEVTDRGVR